MPLALEGWGAWEEPSVLLQRKCVVGPVLSPDRGGFVFNTINVFFPIFQSEGSTIHSTSLNDSNRYSGPSGEG